MRCGWARLAMVLVIAVAAVSAPLDAQVIRFRFQGIDMYGGVVFESVNGYKLGASGFAGLTL